MFIGNKKRPSRLLTYSSGGSNTQIDYVILPAAIMWGMSESCWVGRSSRNYDQLVCDFRAETPPMTKTRFFPYLRTCCLRSPGAWSEYQQVFVKETTWRNFGGGGRDLGKLEFGMLKAAENDCRFANKHWWRNDTWLGNVAVDSAITDKQRWWEAWKIFGSMDG